MLIRPLMTNFKMTAKAGCAASAYRPLPLSIKPLAHCAGGGGGGGIGLWTGVCHPALPLPLFLSTNLAYLLTFLRSTEADSLKTT